MVFPTSTPFGELPVVVADGKSFKHGPDHEMAVGADGSFRVAFSERTKKGKLRIESRYLYLDEPVKLNVRSADEPVVLEPKLGGRIRGTVSASAGSGVLPEDLVEGLKADILKAVDPENDLEPGASRTHFSFVEVSPTAWKLLDYEPFMRVHHACSPYADRDE